MNKSSSSVGQGLKLKQEQAGDGDRQGSGVANCLELRLGISSDNGSSPWRVDPWSLAARQQKASLEKAHLKPDECDLQRFSHHSFYLLRNSVITVTFSCAMTAQCSVYMLVSSFGRCFLI